MALGQKLERFISELEKFRFPEMIGHTVKYI